jgi:hypothetical protein
MLTGHVLPTLCLVEALEAEVEALAEAQVEALAVAVGVVVDVL